MKNRILFASLFLLGGLLITACEKEVLHPEARMEASSTIQARSAIDTIIQLGPDLISRIVTDVTATTTNCGPSLPDVSCYGQHNFTATAIVTNIGEINVPAGTLEIQWRIDGGSPQLQILNHNGIPAGQSVRITRPFFLGPCDCGAPPPMLFQNIIFTVLADPNDQIAEKKENNNLFRYRACNGC
ncbi:MAG: CARDB domain-containing protein [Bacteroidota bacterium]